ncbi:MAG: beta-ketoacyl-ACP synthase III [Candidatus Zixiibacteriota bacterium]
MGHKLSARIAGTGSYTPPHRMTNADLEKLVDTSDDWIVSRTGIRERRIAANGTATSDLAVEACRRAMDMAGVRNDDIDLVINGTVTPDYKLPSTACVIQEKMGLTTAAAFDIAAACTGFINGLSVAKAFIETGQYRRILVVGSEKLSSIVNYTDRATCVLFGDGAGAVVVEASDSDRGILSTYLKSDGRLREWLWVEVGGTARPYTPEYLWNGRDKVLMNGSEVFKVAVREMKKAALRVIEDARLTPADISLLVPHQANLRIIAALAKRLHIGHERMFLNLEKYGNTSAASVPIALDEANRQGRLKPGDHVLMVAFGGGLIWGAALVRW